MSDNRMYFFNIYRDGGLVGSVRAKTSLEAMALAAALLPAGSFKAKRVTSSQAGVSLEGASNKTEKVTSDSEKSSTDENQAKELAENPTDQEDTDKNAISGQATEKQLQAYSDLKKSLIKWDNAKRDGVRTKFRVDENGLMIVRTMAITKDGMIRKRELIIGKGGGIRAYGTKPRGSRKLMVALNDVIKYCFTEKPVEA